MLTRVEELADHAVDLDAVRLAAWYHDAVYQGQPDDEERSAQLAEADLAALGVDPSLVAEVARLVRLTISHQPGHGDRNGEVLSDADLAALGVEPRRYRANTAAIRAEYAHVPDNDFGARRARVVRALLSGPACVSYAVGAQPLGVAGARQPRRRTACARTGVTNLLVSRSMIECMFDSPGSAQLGTFCGVDDAGVVASIGVAAGEENAACARRLEAMGELYARRAPEDETDRINWAIDGHENIVAEISAELRISRGRARGQLRFRPTSAISMPATSTMALR